MKKTAITILGWVISAILIASLAAKIDFGVLREKLLDARWSMLLAAGALNLFVVAAKALRWQWLMQPMAAAPYGGILKATFIGLAGNNLMPARGGDWLRIYLLGRWTGASRPALASITVLEKLFDGLAILVLFGLLSVSSTFPEWVRKGTTIVSIVIAAALALCVLLLLHHRRTADGDEETLGRFSRLARKIGAGLGILADRRMAVITAFASMAICLLQVETIRLCQLAFEIHLPFWVPALVFVAINLAIIVPSAPSGIGPFEAAAVLAYAWQGVGTESAFSIAFLYHVVQFIPVTLIGLAFYFLTGLGRQRTLLQEGAPPVAAETEVS